MERRWVPSAWAWPPSESPLTEPIFGWRMPPATPSANYAPAMERRWVPSAWACTLRVLPSTEPIFGCQTRSTPPSQNFAPAMERRWVPSAWPISLPASPSTEPIFGCRITMTAPSPNSAPAMERRWVPSCGRGTDGIAFDGANIWVANGNSNSVSKLRASDGTTLGTFSVGGGPLRYRLRRRQHLGGEQHQQHRQRAARHRWQHCWDIQRGLAARLASRSTEPTFGWRIAGAALVSKF